MSSGKRILADFKVFSRGYLRNRFGLFFGLIFPVILILIFGAIFSSNSSGVINVYTQNQDNGPVSTQFLAALNSSSTIRVITVSPTQDFSKYLAAHSTSDGIVIPKNFSADYLAGHPVNVTVYGNPTSSTSGIVSGTVNGVINYFNLNYYKQNAVPILGITPTTVNIHQTKYIDFLVPGLIGFAILISPMFSLVNISSDYKKTKLFKQLSLTPLTKMEWLALKDTLVHCFDHNKLRVDGSRWNLAVRRKHRIDPLAHTLPAYRPNAFCFTRHACRNSDKEPGDGRCNRQHSDFSNDVPLRHVLPNQHHATILTDHRSRAATVLRH